ncbi:MAG: Na+/H+ antiporter NhaA, partial [Pseudomonadales bacterium]|nr:Na+/H+ antiporter NhaA [Pseudomonadales bacterium]
FSLLAIKLNWSVLPDDMNWSHVIGVGFLAGIGFTMSMFIAVLAFNAPELVISAKIAIMLGSLISAIIGITWLLLLNKVVAKNAL